MNSLVKSLGLMFCMASACLAQPIYVPVQRTISTPAGNVNYTSNQLVGYMNYGMNYGTAGEISKKYKFTVVLKNDSVFTIKKPIDISGKKHALKGKVNKKKIEITPDQTKEISRKSDYGNARMVGIPADTCWLFLSIIGRIGAYSFVAEADSELLVAIRKGHDGPIVKLTEESLREMLDGYESALRHLEKKRFKRAIDDYNGRR